MLAELKLPEVTDLNQFSLNRQVRENLARFRVVITDKHVPRARQALRKLLGDNTLWFEPVNGGYRLTGETRLGPLFDGNSIDGAGRAASTLRCKINELVRAATTAYRF